MWSSLKVGSGPACYGIERFHPRISTLESLRGFESSNLTLGITRDVPARREGSTDLSRLIERCCHRSGQFYLPDKEFRYLRTVIVTAAVYWGFNSRLCLAANLSF